MRSQKSSAPAMRSSATNSAGPVHMALHDVSAEAAVGAHGKFEIDQRSLMMREKEVRVQVSSARSKRKTNRE